MSTRPTDHVTLLPVFRPDASATVELQFPDGEDPATEGTWLKRLKPGSPLEATLRMARTEIEQRACVRPEAREDAPFEVWPDLSWRADDMTQAAETIRRYTSGVLVPLRLRVEEDDGTSAAYLYINVPDAPGPMRVRVAWLPNGGQADA